MQARSFLLLCVIFALLGGWITSNLLFERDDRITIAKMIIKYPRIFPVSKDTRAAVLNQYERCRSMNETNFVGFKYADNYESSKEVCVDNILKPFINSLERSTMLTSISGQTILMIGNPSNSFLANATGMEGLTDTEASRYLNNIRLILEALPKNLPDKKVLSAFSIVDVKFYDRFARITYEEDRLADGLKKKNEPYRGQF